MRPTVSVIIPSFNARGYVLEAVDSVLGQSMVPDEILVIDDGSTDGSRDLLAERYAKDQRVRILQHPDGQRRGVIASRKCGAMTCTSHYAALLDADDVWLPRKLEHQVALFRQYPETILVHSPADMLYEDPAESACFRQPLYAV